VTSIQINQVMSVCIGN